MELSGPDVNGAQEPTLRTSEKVMLTAICALAVSFLGWTGVTLYSVSVRLAVIESQMDSVVEASKANSADRYTSGDATRDIAAQALRDERQNARLDRLENRAGINKGYGK